MEELRQRKLYGEGGKKANEWGIGGNSNFLLPCFVQERLKGKVKRPVDKMCRTRGG